VTLIPTTFQGSQAAAGEPWIGYIRVSTYYEDKISPDIQRSSIQAWADRNGKRIVGWVEDLDMTGRNFKRKIMGAIKSVEDGTARGIAVWRYSRFGRSRHGNALNLARLEAVGGRLESATEAVDTSTAFGRLQQGLAFKFAEFESDRIGEQWAETMENRRNRGLPSTGKKRWGYIWHQRRLDDDGVLHPEWYEPDPKLGLLVTDIYQRIADGRTMNSVIRQLGSEGYVGTRGVPWRQSSLTKYLDSGFAAGWIRYHPTDCDCPPTDPDGKASRTALCPVRIFIPGAQEVIVKEDVWEAYKEQREVARKTPARVRTSPYASSGLVRCGRCGGGANICNGATHGAGGVLINKPGYLHRCSTRSDSGSCDGVYIKRAVVESAILERLAEMAAEIEADAATIPQQSAPADENRAERTLTAKQQLSGQLDEIAREMDRQTSLVSRGIIPEESYVRERDRLTSEQLSITVQLAELDQAPEETTDRAALLPVIRGLLGRWELTPVESRQTMLRTVLRGVWAYPKREQGLMTLPPYAVAVAVWEDPPALWGPRGTQPTA
jgi:DNA invertase Pin-like site-specific DNA recombinase